jgi:hypothetical protein
VEQSMQSDRPGIIMRQRLHELIKAHGEQEIFRSKLIPIKEIA